MEDDTPEADLLILYRIRDNAHRRLAEGNEQARSVLIAVEGLIAERERALLSEVKPPQGGSVIP